jgi:two-component system sensor histidine kinase CssS
MIGSKRSIKNKIFLSHIWIIAISVILTAIVFNICLNVYVRRQTKAQLTSAAELVKKTMNAEMININIFQTATKEEREFVKSLLKINKVLKQTQTFLDINYAILGKNANLIYPKDISVENYEQLTSTIIPALEKKKLNLTEGNKNRLVYFTANDVSYSAIIYPIKGEGGNSTVNLLLYSDLNRSRKLIFAVDIILFSILLLTGIIALAISNTVSKKISDPIASLNKYAKKIGEREYETEIIKYDEDEIGELAETMHGMAQKLGAYDNTMKSFLQNASHELRTPLMSIQGYAEGIRYGVVEDIESATDIIIEESKRLSVLVDDLIYLSKIDSFQEKLEIEEIILEDLLKSSIERVSGIVINNNKDIKLSILTKGIKFNGDEEKLNRAFINVLGNCLRHANKQVDVILDKEGSKIKILIRDDGSGFENSDLDKAFNRFFKGQGGNYGLGLTITKSIIEKHNGTITAGNNPEGGAYFEILI